MLGEPQILILDEPINGLDPSGIIEFRNLLRRLNEEKKITILLSSHILAELQQIADVYGFLSRGVLLEEISTEELRERCADCIELSLSDTAGYCVYLEKAFPEENYKVLPQDKVRIYAPKRQGEAYSRLAAEHDIAIKSMQTLQSSLEDYYMKLKERGAGK